jgi:hypothetical protein
MPRRIPVELFRQVVENVESKALASLALVSRDFQFEAERLLYRAISYFSPAFSHNGGSPDVENLVKQSRVWQYVQKYDIFVSASQENSHIIRQCIGALLPKMIKLTALHISSPPYNPTRSDTLWQFCGDIFESCTFSLRSFSSCFGVDGDFVSFLASQPAITELAWNSNLPSSHRLPASALPNLHSLTFRNLSAPEFLCDIAPGRPITHASGDFDLPDLHVLATCSGPPRCLQMTDMDEDELEGIARVLPNLEFLSNIKYDDFQVAFHDLRYSDAMLT